MKENYGQRSLINLLGFLLIVFHVVRNSGTYLNTCLTAFLPKDGFKRSSQISALGKVMQVSTAGYSWRQIFFEDWFFGLAVAISAPISLIF